MSYEWIISFSKVWKKYSKQPVLNNSLREELVTLISGKKCPDELSVGEFWALKDLSISIKKGECIGLCGPNGSGKSTILKLIANVSYPNKGQVRVNGRVAPLIELGAGMHPDLTGIENIYMNGAILGSSIKELKWKSNEIIEFSGLREFINVPVKKYSSGMFLRLAFSIAVHSPADIFLFDEVLAVGDKDFQNKCEEKIKLLLSQQRTVLLVSHDIETINRLTTQQLKIIRGNIET